MMTFEDWYEFNKEHLTTHMLRSKLREAWKAGVEVGKAMAALEVAESMNQVLSPGGGTADAPS